MGDFRPYTKVELAQIERDQEDPRWLEWVNPELMAAQIDKLMTETIPDMPDDPWSAEGLDRLEREILDRFTEVDQVYRPENRDVADQMARFIGEVFRRNFEGTWFNSNDDMGGGNYSGFGPVIRHEWVPAYLHVENLVSATVDRQFGDYLSEIFNGNKKTYDSWVQAGRPPMSEWMQIHKL